MPDIIYMVCIFKDVCVCVHVCVVVVVNDLSLNLGEINRLAVWTLERVFFSKMSETLEKTHCGMSQRI